MCSYLLLTILVFFLFSKSAHYDLTGSLAVVSAKALSSLFILTVTGHNQLAEAIFYLALLLLIMLAIGQIRLINALLV